MSSNEVNVSRAEAEDPHEAVQAQLEADFSAALQKAETELELGQAPPGFGFWNIWAFGPRQALWRRPSRIIEVGQPAVIHTVVWMDRLVMCPNVTGFGAKIQLNYFTSNMQTMTAVPALSRTRCIQTILNRCVYHDWWWFTPTEAACLYEVNICARICRCDGTGVPHYGAFVRYVYDYDPEVIFPRGGPQFHPAGWSFDHPIRYGVFDPRQPCCP